MAGIGYVGKVLWGISAGFYDRIASRVTGTRVCFGKALCTKMSRCEPWSDHIDSKSLQIINNRVNSGSFEDARTILSLAEKPDADSYCIRLLLATINFMAEGEEFLCEASPFYWM